MKSPKNRKSTKRKPSRKPSWAEFRHRFIDCTWFDRDRVKTFRAMREFWKRAPAEVLRKLPAVSVVAPSGYLLGAVTSFGRGDRAFLYLAPQLEKASQAEAIWTVAHEFSHVALRHHAPYKGRLPSLSTLRAHARADEKAADALATEWGFVRPKGPRRQ